MGVKKEYCYNIIIDKVTSWPCTVTWSHRLESWSSSQLGYDIVLYVWIVLVNEVTNIYIHNVSFPTLPKSCLFLKFILSLFLFQSQYLQMFKRADSEICKVQKLLQKVTDRKFARAIFQQTACCCWGHYSPRTQFCTDFLSFYCTVHTYTS